MKRKLNLHRETLRNVETQEIQEVQGGGFTDSCGSCYRTCTCLASCGGTCTPSCFDLC